MRALYEIAREIDSTWISGKGVSPYARPYLDAMYALITIDDMYGFDTADSVVRYFLANANGWRGEDAKRIKAELREMLS